MNELPMADEDESDSRVERCETCRFWNESLKDTWNKEEDDQVFHAPCHRFPPAFSESFSENRGYVPNFPYTASFDWCGEWRRARTEAAPKRGADPQKAATTEHFSPG